MDIEKIKVMTTLKAGGTVYKKDSTYPKDGKQIPADLISEVKKKRGTVEVLSSTTVVEKASANTGKSPSNNLCPFCDHPPFKSSSALKAHLTKVCMNKDGSGKDGKDGSTDETEQTQILGDENQNDGTQTQTDSSGIFNGNLKDDPE